MPSQVATGNTQPPTSGLTQRKACGFETIWAENKTDIPNKPTQLAPNKR